MRTINFTKMNGAGNDFILIHSENNKEIFLERDLIKKICHRRKGIGADGVLIVDTKSEYDFDLTYYNSDGSLGSLCGNGARCSIKFALETFLQDKNTTVFNCNGKIYSGGKRGENILFRLLPPKNLKQNININIEDKIFTADFIDTGSPHAVFYWEDIKNGDEEFHEFNIFAFGRKVRFSKEFEPDGTNVNIVNYEDSKFYIRTYERGVESETLACGTGTVAAAILSNLKYNVKPPVKFITVDKDELTVDFVKNNKNFSEITLTGPAKINYIGSYNF